MKGETEQAVTTPTEISAGQAAFHLKMGCFSSEDGRLQHTRRHTCPIVPRRNESRAAPSTCSCRGRCRCLLCLHVSFHVCPINNQACGIACVRISAAWSCGQTNAIRARRGRNEAISSHPVLSCAASCSPPQMISGSPTPVQALRCCLSRRAPGQKHSLCCIQ
jgi:hypothetical protein